jgi:ubiquinone/menaquinone biosynthesis C-methylase UbiE
MKLEKELTDGVNFLTDKNELFSSKYLLVRELEGRVLSDAEVIRLPITNRTSSNHNEWELRRKSAQRILNYIKNKNKPLNILDIGCGNGWFTNHLASIEKTIVHGLDINSVELEQASRIFKKGNLKFLYADFYEIPPFFKNNYDIITLNASIQYFDNLKELLSVIKSFLKPNGEIHILDSPFYRKEEVDNAKKRTKNYYSLLGIPEMSNHYFHHCIEDIQDFEVLYRPAKNILHILISKKDSPFYWFKKSIK